MSDPARAEEVVAYAEVDPPVPDEECDLTFEDLERLVRVAWLRECAGMYLETRLGLAE